MGKPLSSFHSVVYCQCTAPEDVSYDHIIRIEQWDLNGRSFWLSSHLKEHPLEQCFSTSASLRIEVHTAYSC